MNNAKNVSRIFNGILCPLPGVYVFDSVHTFAEFSAQHLIVGHVRGRFDKITAELTVTDDPTQSSLTANIETNSISSNNSKRDEDLRSERFFDVTKYPLMTYKSHEFIAELEGRWNVIGDLTIKGITVSVPLTGEFTGVMQDQTGKILLGIKAYAKANRTDFGLLTDLEKENGGVALGHDIIININAEAILQQ